MKTLHCALIVCFSLALASPALAHRINIFALDEGGEVYTESTFAGKRPVKKGTVRVLRADGTLLLTGGTNEEGIFTFPRPEPGALIVEVDAGQGHKNRWELEAAEGAVEPHDPTPVASVSPEKTDPVTGLSPGEWKRLEQVVDTAVIKALHQAKEETRLQDIVGGLGYIVGLFGATKPEIILILGTGLSGLADHLDAEVCIPYHEIPHFPQSTVASHAGNLIFGRLGGKQVAALQGRFHFYEGYSTLELTFPVRVLSLLGAETLLVSNAAGGLNPAYQPGTLMVLRDHINLIPDNPLRGKNIDDWGVRFPDLSATYDRELIDKTLACADQLGFDRIESGVYVAIPGPSLETPAETRYLRQIGADAVGMSTVPEVIVAKHAGLKVLGISVVSNVNDPDNQQPILLEEIIAETEKTATKLVNLILQLLQKL